MADASVYYVYILASGRHRTLYIGVTNNIHVRLEQHRSGRGSEFVKKYRVHRLVYTETFPSAREAIAREKQLKNWRRDWKIRLIEEDNLDWSNLSDLLRAAVVMGPGLRRDDGAATGARSQTSLTDLSQRGWPKSMIDVAIRAVMHSVAACPRLVRVPARLHLRALTKGEADEPNQGYQGEKRQKPIRQGHTSPIWFDRLKSANLASICRQQSVAAIIRGELSAALPLDRYAALRK